MENFWRQIPRQQHFWTVHANIWFVSYKLYLWFSYLILTFLFKQAVRTRAANIRTIGVKCVLCFAMPVRKHRQIHPWELFSPRSILPYTRMVSNTTLARTSFQTGIIQHDAIIQGLIPVLLHATFRPVSQLLLQENAERGTSLAFIRSYFVPTVAVL